MRQLALEFAHRPAFGREDFLVSDSNREAVGWVDLWPNWPAPGLIIFGPESSGKTHLAEVWRARTAAVRIDVSELAGDGALRRHADKRAMVIEGPDRGVDEVALLHLYNALAERRGHVLLTATTPPRTWPLKLPDLTSRLYALPTVAIRAPDDALMEAVLVKLFADRQLRIEPELVAYLVARLDRSFTAATAAVAALDRAALATRRSPTIPLAREALREAGLLA